MASQEPNIIPDSCAFEMDEDKLFHLETCQTKDEENKSEGETSEANIYSQQQSQELIVDCGEANLEFNLPVWNALDNAEVIFQEPNEDIDADAEELGNEKFDISKYMCSAADLVEHYLTSGCPEIDNFLKGGFPAFGITEISGESGSGKTQLCLQLSLTCQLPVQDGGLDSSVLYISTEKEFPSIRLHGLTKVFKQKYGDEMPKNPMDFVFVKHIDSEEELQQCLEIKLDALARKQGGKLRLVIIDSIAGIFRYLESAKDNWEERANRIRNVAQTLAEYSYDHKAVVVACNQITADLASGSSVSALGMAWRTTTTTRIRLQKYVGQRTMRVTESPHIPSSTISFVVEEKGIRAA